MRGEVGKEGVEGGEECRLGGERWEGICIVTYMPSYPDEVSQ